MLFVLTGSSAAGKSTALSGLAARVEHLDLHDFDELGAPRGGSTRWRQEATEEWAKRAIAARRDVLIAAQSPLGEWLAAPSAPALGGIAVCLLDVSDSVRAGRLAGRSGVVAPDRTEIGHMLAWASWHRSHAQDPQFRQDVIRQRGWEAMCWERWQDWRREDPRWDVATLHTTAAPVEETAEQLAGWIARRRASRDAGALALSGRWWA